MMSFLKEGTFDLSLLNTEIKSWEYTRVVYDSSDCLLLAYNVIVYTSK